MDLEKYKKAVTLIIFSLGILAIFLSILGPLLSHFELLSPLKGLRLLIRGGKLWFFTFAISLFAILFFRIRSQDMKSIIWASLPGLVVSLVFLLLFLHARRYPPINDVTTTPEDPPQFQKILELPENKGKNMLYPANFAEIQKKAYPDISPRVIEMGPDRLFRKVHEVVRKISGWEIVSENPDTKTLEAIATTYLFHFKDDVIIQVHPLNAGTVVHMRSKSRVGVSDIGANAKRIRTFFSVLKELTQSE